MKLALPLAAALVLGNAPAAPDRSIVVEFTLLQDGQARPLLEGKMPLRPRHAAEFEQSGGQTLARIGLVLNAHQEGDVVSLDVSVDERTADGTRLRWSPTIEVKPGGSATASITWPSGARTLKVAIR